MVTSSGLMRIVTPCWKPAGGGGREGGGSSRRGSGGGSVTLGRVDGLTWYKDLGQHVNGEFSMAVVQANALLEDQSQLESGPLGNGACPPHGTFVGVYDGHGGPEAARFVADSLFGHLKKLTSDELGVSTDVISKSFSTTEEDFLSLVRKSWQTRPQLAAVGACCLVGIICGGMLYIANAGDSRAVLATTRKGSRDVTALQMSEEHNASIESVREELRLQHPEDPNIVVLKHNVWRVKGIIQISRSIGDAYLKNAEFNKEPLLPKFRLPKPFPKPILSAEPSVITHKLSPEDQFLIFASDGLWEHLSNQQAVGIVANSPRNGIARRLIKAALQEAAKKREMRYSDLIKIDRGVRRHFHDDITVVVVFLDNALRSSYLRGQTVSLRAAGFPL